MGVFGFSGDKPGPGVHEPPPEKGFPRYKFIVQNHFFRLIWLNLLFVVFCIPVFTMPASIAGMTSVLMCLVRDGNTNVWDDFWAEFKADFPRRMFLWFLLQLVPTALYYLPAALHFENVAYAASVLCGALLFVVECYWFPMIVKLDLSVWQAFRNALLLVPLEWKRSLLLLALGAGVSFLVALCYPYSLPVLLIGAFSFLQLAVCVIVNEPINTRLLKQQGAEEPPQGDQA